MLTRPDRVAAISVAPKLHNVKMQATLSHIFLRDFWNWLRVIHRLDARFGVRMVAREIEGKT
jgi:hypothetical protein